MEFQKPNLKVNDGEYELLTLEEFRERKSDPDLSTPTITYAIKSNKLDYVQIGRIKHIVWNEKAKMWKPGGGRPRLISKITT